MPQWELPVLLSRVQEYISKNYAAALIEDNKGNELKAYIRKYLYDEKVSVSGYDSEHLVHRLYSEMAEYSLLSACLHDPDIEEININSWNDIALTHIDGRIEKMGEHFFSQTHALDIVKRLLRHSGMIIDNAVPIAQGHLPGNIRITALQAPVVDEECGVSVSIRILHPKRVNRTLLTTNGTLTEEMLSFLETCLRYGVSLVISGRTAAGKTTLLGNLLDSIPNCKRIYSVESGARELSLIKHDDEGKVANNVVQTLSRPSENSSFNISQEDLVMTALRFSPDVIVIGEMRDAEAYTAVEASSTDHTVITTVHGGGGRFAHMRIAFLSQKRFPVDMKISVQQAALAFPIVVFTHRLENNAKKVMDISECEVIDDGKLIYHTLYRYHIHKNIYENGKYVIEGEFVKENTPSASLQEKLIRGGIPQEILAKFMSKEMKP